MTAATDRQRAVRDAVLRWLLAKSMEGDRGRLLDPDAIGETVGWTLSPLTRDEVAEASNHLFRTGHLTGVPVIGLGIPRPILTVAGRRATKAAQSLRARQSTHDRPKQQEVHAARAQARSR
ncbi:MAG TPA: serine recombinase [Aldersonia sp.]